MARTVRQETEVPVDGRRRHDKRRHNNQPYKRRKRGMTRGGGGQWCCRDMTTNMWQGCEVCASSLMPLGTVVVEEERRRIAKMFQGVGNGG